MSQKIMILFLFLLFGVCCHFLLASDENKWPSDYEQQIKNGERLADEALKDHNKLTEGKQFKPTAGTLVAEGDSWFDFPLFDDVLERLQWQYRYDVRHSAHHGDTLESMAYDNKQYKKFISELKKVKEKLPQGPKAILISGGGNDIAHHELYVLLNHANALKPALNDDLIKMLIKERLRDSMLTLIGAISRECAVIFENPKIPVIVHGYANPVPDGRGYLGGYWALPGPWLNPSFREKGYITPKDDLCDETRMMRLLIKEYNKVLKEISEKLPHVHYVNVACLFKNPEYKEDWADELHPTEQIFGEVAGAFDKVIKALPKKTVICE
jgi:lysophospholipase L1-like esterase